MDRKVTIYTLAEQLGMSVSAVSRAFKPDSKLSSKKREIILKAAEDLGYVQNKMASRLSMKSIRICVLVYGRFKPYYEELIAGINDAYKEFSDYKVICDMYVLPMVTHAVEDAYDILDEFMQQKPDGIILHGLYGEDVARRINKLTDMGVKVATLHNDISSSKRLFTSISNTEITGKIAVQLLDIFLCNKPRNIVLFSGSMQSLVHQNLTFSFVRHAMDANLVLLRHYDTEDLPEKAEKMVAEAFETFNDINGIYVCSANSIPVCQYIEKHGLSEKVVLITSDVFPELNYYLKNGLVSATIYQDPFVQGQRAFESLYQNISEGKPVKSMIMSNPQIVLKSNLSIYQN